MITLLILFFGLPVYANSLAGHPSPYLAMHGNDPVSWYEWGDKALQLSRESGKLIYLSSGYFACHWCHVMQRESYQNKEIAGILNKHFIPVKIDRELNPALDDRLISFVRTTSGNAGWPLNVFITPQGYPLVGMTYEKPEAFKKILTRLYKTWKNNKRDLSQQAKNAMLRWTPKSKPARGELNWDKVWLLADHFLKQIFKQADDMLGGFGAGSKFPSVPRLKTLLNIQQQKPLAPLEEFLVLTLDQMSTQGLRDHIEGGFFRYTIDPGWHVPHFEKMLYDNAQLSELYLQASFILKNNAYREVAFETLDFLLQNFRTDQGAFISSFSAVDGNNTEGGYYLYSKQELDSILSPKEKQVADLLYGFSGMETIEGKYHLILISDPASIASQTGFSIEQVNKLIPQIRQSLKLLRQDREKPADTKILASWNGLLLRSLTLGSLVDKQNRYLEPAKKLATFLVTKLWDGKHLARSSYQNKLIGDAAFEDYANVADGLVTYGIRTKDEHILNTARDIIKTSLDIFRSNSEWLLSAHMKIPLNNSKIFLADGVMPAPDATLLDAGLRLAEYTKDEQLLGELKRLLLVDHITLEKSPVAFASRIQSLLRWAD